MKSKIFILGILATILAMGLGAEEALADGAVAGVVIDADGEPVGGAVVSIMGQQRRRGQRPFRARLETNEDGTFGLRGVPAGRYRVVAGARELGRAAARIAVQDDEVTRIRLQLRGRRGGGGGGGDDEERPDPGSVVGQITNADGEPVAGAFVGLRSAERGRRGRGIRTRTNEEGMFAFEAVPAGNYRIMAGARGVGRARGEVEVAAGEESEVNLQLQGR